MAALKALLAQTAAWLLLWSLLRATGLSAPSPMVLAFGQGLLAAAASAALRAPGWWLPIHLLFSPLLVFAAELGLAPGWYLAGFVLLLLVYWSNVRHQVPLYLSNRATAHALAALLPAQPNLSVIDIGCGTGVVLRRLAQARPDCRFAGVETAPLPYLAARFNTREFANCAVRRLDLWDCPLGDFDVVYAFLSPVPMTRLWRKACSEMRPRSLLVSNSFPIAGVACERIVEVGDRRGTRLYLYRI